VRELGLAVTFLEGSLAEPLRAHGRFDLVVANLPYVRAGDIPGVLGHPSIPQTSAHPVGCQALLPFGNPYYLDMQVQCVCMAIGGTTSWQCAL